MARRHAAALLGAAAVAAARSRHPRERLPSAGPNSVRHSFTAEEEEFCAKVREWGYGDC